MSYRPLTEKEISQLQQQACNADDWNAIQVKEGFAPDRIRHTTFHGAIQLGVFNKNMELYPGVKISSGLSHCALSDCVIEDDAYIHSVGHLARYHVGPEAVIDNVNRLWVTGNSRFGNGVRIEILNEGGGRELPIYDTLSAQVAYFMVLYRHDPAFIQKIEQLIDGYCDSKAAECGYIGNGARITHCMSIRNVWIGDQAEIDGAAWLDNGTIASVSEAPVRIGPGVNAENFIVQSGSAIEGGVMMSKSFVGQGVRLGKQFSAENSAFFANCEGFHGEACSIFAGPYTVTHHKSTLLIAGLFSFYNAGSGTNQSNHMYKLGPVHQGILERGVKTGTLSYLLWPSRIGAFTAVIGKHYVNFNSSDFPFSYVNEEDGKSVLTPAMNLFTVGTKRDSAKWPARDKRKAQTRYDRITFDLFNPYTIGKIWRGRNVLLNLYEQTGKDKEYVQIKGLHIKRLLLKRCARYYEIALKIFIGDCCVQQLKAADSVVAFLHKVRRSGLPEPLEPWLDAAGLIIPPSLAHEFMQVVKEGKLTTTDDLQSYFEKIDGANSGRIWNFALKLAGELYGKPLSQFERSDWLQLLQDWKSNCLKFNSMILSDAKKEFDASARIGFGIDGPEETAQLDFQNVRGSYETNSFIRDLQEESSRIEKEAADWITWIEKEM